MTELNSKPWLKNYPEGIKSDINFDEYNSLVDMFDRTCDRFNSKKSFGGTSFNNIKKMIIKYKKIYI